MLSNTLLASALLAYSVHEHQEGFVTEIDVCIDLESITVQDNGRGMGLDRNDYVENLMALFSGGSGPILLHGVGLSLIAASTPMLIVQSKRKGVLWEQSFAYGVSTGPSLELSACAETGTRIKFILAAAARTFEINDFAAQVLVWRERNPTLSITVRNLTAA